jgi:predicted tellurium resistance membrane protein TerC
MTWRHFYLEPLAVLFSLTYALLMWSCVIASLFHRFQIVTITNLFSVCMFFLALLLFSFQNATTHIRAWVGTASGIVTILVACCIINSWESDSGDSERDEVIDIISEDGSHTA